MNENKSKKQKSSLTKRQKDILVGLLLGDGCLETQTNGKTFRLKVEHSQKQKDYVYWLYKEFKNIIPGEIYERKRLDGRLSVGFQTHSSSSFRFFYHQFYPNGKKVIPKVIGKIIQPISIAVWFMDDGSKKSSKHKTYNIHTLGFEKKDLERMQKIFDIKFQIKTSLHRQKDKYWRIYILSESANQFKILIKDFVKEIASMKHKIG